MLRARWKRLKKKLKAITIFIVGIILASVLYQNFIISTGYYYANEVTDAGRIIISDIYDIDLNKFKLSEVVVNKRIAVSEGIIFLKISVAEDNLENFLRQIKFNHVKIYLSDQNQARDFDYINHEEEPYLLGEKYDPSINKKDIIKRWEKEDENTINYAIISSKNEYVIYVDKEENGTNNIYLEKVILGSEISKLQKGYFLRKWF